MNEKRLDAIADVFAQVRREVWIVTASSGQAQGGLVATWVSQVSIDRQHPTAACAIVVNHFTRELIDASGAFAVHLIGEAQVDLAWNFALGSGRDRNKFAGVEYRLGETGSPILSTALAWLECRVYHRVDGGDRIYYWGDVVDGSVAQTESVSGQLPLVDHRLLELASEEQKKVLREEMLADISVQRSLLEAWRSQLEQ